MKRNGSHRLPFVHSPPSIFDQRLPPLPPAEEPVPPAELLPSPLRAVAPPDGFELFGPPSLAVPVEALLPDADGLVVAPALEPAPLVVDADEPGTFDGLRLFGPPSLAVPVDALLPEGVFTPGCVESLVPAIAPVLFDGLRLFGPPSLAVPVDAVLPEAPLLRELVPIGAVEPEAPIGELACTPSESSVC
jgi:hypothetical protein